MGIDLQCNSLNTDKNIFLVFANLIAHVINAGTLEVDESTTRAPVLAKHLFSFADDIFVGDINTPALLNRIYKLFNRFRLYESKFLKRTVS